MESNGQAERCRWEAIWSLVSDARRELGGLDDFSSAAVVAFIGHEFGVDLQNKPPVAFWEELSRSNVRIRVANTREVRVDAVIFIYGVYVAIIRSPDADKFVKEILRPCGGRIRKNSSLLHEVARRCCVQYDDGSSISRRENRWRPSEDVRAICYLIRNGIPPNGVREYRLKTGGGVRAWAEEEARERAKEKGTLPATTFGDSPAETSSSQSKCSDVIACDSINKAGTPPSEELSLRVDDGPEQVKPRKEPEDVCIPLEQGGTSAGQNEQKQHRPPVNKAIPINAPAPTTPDRAIDVSPSPSDTPDASIYPCVLITEPAREHPGFRIAHKFVLSAYTNGTFEKLVKEIKNLISESKDAASEDDFGPEDLMDHENQTDDP